MVNMMPAFHSEMWHFLHSHSLFTCQSPSAISTDAGPSPPLPGIPSTDRDAQGWGGIMPCLHPPPWAGDISPELHYHPLCCWPPTNTSLPISISCLPDTSLQRGYHLRLISPGSTCSNPTLFPPEGLLERACMLSTVSLAGAGRANFLPPSIKHRTTSQGLVCTLTSGTVISGVSCFWWCQCSCNGKNKLKTSGL